MDKLTIAKASILGWSLGSFVGQIVAADYPTRIDKVMLVSTAPGGEAMVNGSEEISNEIQKTLDGAWETTYVPYLFPKEAEKQKQAYLQRREKALASGESPKTAQTDIQTLLNIERMFADQEQELKRSEGLTSIKAPTLIIAGEKDQLLPVENAKRVASQIPNASLSIDPEAGHAVLFQNPKTVAKQITDFLKR